MNACQGHTSCCTGADLIPVQFGRSPRTLLICSGCRGTSLFQSAYTVERRARAVPVATERRRDAWKPVWLRNLTARDETGLLR